VEETFGRLKKRRGFEELFSFALGREGNSNAGDAALDWLGAHTDGGARDTPEGGRYFCLL